MPQGAGPPYPRYAPGTSPGGQPIGQFMIGFSPIGTIPVFDVWATVIAQYANSQALTSLITSLNSALDPTANLDSFYDFIWNVLTAQGVGLDIWGRIVGVQRSVSIPAGSPLFGFNEASSWVGFGQGGFFSGQGFTSTFTLADADFRTLILAKAATNICDGSIPGINAVLLALFGTGYSPSSRPFVADGLNMTMTYFLPRATSPVLQAIVQTPGIVPKPAGVAATFSFTL